MSRIESNSTTTLPQTGTTMMPDSENSYSVKKGDTLGEIAKAHGLSLETLIESNPQIANPNNIEIGDQINLPSSPAPQAPVPNENSTPATPAAATEAKGYMDMGASLMQKTLHGAVDAGRNLYNSFTGEKPVAIAPGTPPAPSEPKAPVQSAQELAKVDTSKLTTETEKYDHFKQLIEAGGGTFNAQPGARNIVSIRNQDSVDAGRNDEMGTYNDKIAVVWSDADGTKHAKEFEGNVDPNRHWSNIDSPDVNDDGQKDAGRLPSGFYKYEVSSRTVNGKTEDALRPVNDVMVERDMNHDGLFNDAGTDGSLSSARRSILFHNGKGNTDTGSAGCQTIKKDDWGDFWKAVTDGATNQQEIGYTLVQKD